MMRTASPGRRPAVERRRPGGDLADDVQLDRRRRPRRRPARRSRRRPSWRTAGRPRRRRRRRPAPGRWRRRAPSPTGASGGQASSTIRWASSRSITAATVPVRRDGAAPAHWSRCRGDAFSADGHDVRWTTWDGDHDEHLTLRWENEAWTATGEVGRERVQYVLRLSPTWRVRQFLLFRDLDEPDLWLATDGHARWGEVNGAHRPELDGCSDIELACSPFPATLPIRRLPLDVGDGAELPVDHRRRRDARRRTWRHGATSASASGAGGAPTSAGTRRTSSTSTSTASSSTSPAASAGGDDPGRAGHRQTVGDSSPSRNCRSSPP